MHANRNKKAVKRVEKGMMKANRIRNLFAVFAIVLTTFMMFFASTFWTKLQNTFGHCCMSKLDKVAMTRLAVQQTSRKPLQTLSNSYSTRYGNGSSEFSSSCACSLK